MLLGPGELHYVRKPTWDYSARGKKGKSGLKDPQGCERMMEAKKAWAIKAENVKRAVIPSYQPPPAININIFGSSPGASGSSGRGIISSFSVFHVVIHFSLEFFWNSSF